MEVIGQKPDKEITESLSTKVVKGGLWIFALRIINRGLGFIRTIVLARLLTPEDFGLLGIAMLGIYTLETFSQTGFQTALIQKKGKVDSYLDTAWTVSVVRGTTLFLVLFLSAPIIASFFNSPDATLVIKVIAISTLLSGFRNIGIVFFQKDLEFNKQFVYDLSATLVDLTVAITLAFVLRNVWALVFGGLAANCIRTLMSYTLHPYRPQFDFEKDKFHGLFGFGKWVLGSSILIFLVTRGDDILVGKMLGVTALGLYQMAYLIANLPTTEITHVISQVTYPAYSALQDNIDRLRQAYIDVLQITVYVAAPLAGVIFALAPELTNILFGKSWINMASSIQVLVLAALLRSIAATAGPIFQGVGKPKIDTKWQIIRLLTLVLFIYPFTLRWGIFGTSLAVFLSILACAIGFAFNVVQITQCGFRSYLKMIFLPLLNTATMVSIIFLLKFHYHIVGLLQLTFFVLIAIITYLFVTYVFELLIDYGIVKLIKEKLAYQ